MATQEMRVIWSESAETQLAVLTRHYKLTPDHVTALRATAEERATASRLRGLGLIHEHRRLIDLTDMEVQRMDNTPPMVLPGDVWQAM